MSIDIKELVSKNKNITTNFKWKEVFRSSTADKLGIDNTDISDEYLENVRRLADSLEVVRSLCGDRPIIISSWYRCEALNEKVGGTPTSHHRIGAAVDFHVKGLTIMEVIQKLREASKLDMGFSYTQLIDEYQQWVHLSVVKGYLKKENLKFTRDENGKKIRTVITD